MNNILGIQRLVLASNNAGKLREFARLLSPLGIEVIPQRELGLDDAEETGLSFVENAILKARHASAHTGLPALADDSGLEVVALNGAPGIYSARYSGEGATDERNNQLLLSALSDFNDAQRAARYRCVLALMRHASDPSPMLAEGEWHGRILSAARGRGGFGYDPVFWVEECQCSAAELSAADKDERSHRALATRRLLDKLYGAAGA